MLKDLGDITVLLTGLGNDMAAMNNVLGAAQNLNVVADKKKQPRILHRERISTERFPCFRTYFNKVTFFLQF